ncbi:MAG: DUF2182 domain-containing protein [Burkholderiales bacterium]
MMIAMMAPSAAPTRLLYARVNRHALAQGRDKFAPTGAFAAGCLLVWLGFSVAAAALHWALERAGLVSAMLMGSQSRWLSSAGSETFANCLRTTVDNYTRFASEYAKNLYDIVVEGQKLVTRQVEEGNRRFAEVADISGRAAQSTNESMRLAGEVLERGRSGKPRAS